MSEYRRELHCTGGDLVALARGIYGALAPDHGLDLTTRRREQQLEGEWSNDGTQGGETRWELGDDTRGLALREVVEVRDIHAVIGHWTTRLEITARGLSPARSLDLRYDSRSTTLRIAVTGPDRALAMIDRIVGETLFAGDDATLAAVTALQRLSGFFDLGRLDSAPRFDSAMTAPSPDAAEAVARLDVLHARRPGDAVIAYLRALALAKAGRHADALAALVPLALPQVPAAIAWVHRHAGQPERVLAAPGAGAWIEQARVRALIALDRPRDALAALAAWDRASTSLNIGEILGDAVLFVRAVLLHAAGDLADARTVLDEAVGKHAYLSRYLTDGEPWTYTVGAVERYRRAFVAWARG